MKGKMLNPAAYFDFLRLFVRHCIKPSLVSSKLDGTCVARQVETDIEIKKINKNERQFLLISVQSKCKNTLALKMKKKN